MPRFNLHVEWLPSPGPDEAPGPVHAATWGHLAVELEGHWLTAHSVAHEHGREETFVVGSLAGLAEWLVDNWLFLLWELHTPFPKTGSHAASARVPSLSDAAKTWRGFLRDNVEIESLARWQHRHSFGHADSDVALPSIVFVPDEKLVGISIGPAPLDLDATTAFRLHEAPGRREPIWVPKDDLVTALRSFVTKTIEQAASGSAAQWATWLRGRFDTVQAEAADESVRRRLALGELVERRWTSLMSRLGANAGALYGVLIDSAIVGDEADLNALVEAVIQAAGDRVNDDRVLWRTFTAQSGEQLLPPYERGYRLAARARAMLGEPEAPLDMHDALSRFGVSMRPFAATQLFRSASVVGTQGSATVLYAKEHPQFTGVAAQRFAIAAGLGRLLADAEVASAASFGAAHGSQSRWLKAQAANAFAAEFLLPIGALERSADLGSLCEVYGISHSAAEWHRKNRLAAS